MYTNQEASAVRQQFWTSLGRYLSPIPSAAGHKVNWINYKTGVRNILVKMDADQSGAMVTIEINGDAEKRDKIFSLFLSLKSTAKEYFKKEWSWQPGVTDIHGKIIACIYCSKKNVNIFKKEDWPALISFFKTAILGFDIFWAERKDIFEMQT